MPRDAIDEGAVRVMRKLDYDTFGEEVRAGASAVKLDPTVFPNAAALKANTALGRLTIRRRETWARKDCTSCRGISAPRCVRC
jgi:hypothetical protein